MDRDIFDILSRLQTDFLLSEETELRKNSYLEDRLANSPELSSRYFDLLARVQRLPPLSLSSREQSGLESYRGQIMHRFGSNDAVLETAAQWHTSKNLRKLKELLFIEYSFIRPEEITEDDLTFIDANMDDLLQVSDEFDKKAFIIAEEHGRLDLMDNRELELTIEGYVRVMENQIEFYNQNAEGGYGNRSKERR